MHFPRRIVPVLGLLAAFSAGRAAYLNFESSQVHPIALNASADRLLVLNTPDARLEVFSVAGDGSLAWSFSVPVGLEPVSLAWRLNAATGREEAWVVNHLSDSVSVVDLGLRQVVRTLSVGDEPTDIVFASGRAFVSISQEDAIRVYSLANPGLAPTVVPLFGRQPRALAANAAGTRVYTVLQKSGNQTTVVDANVIFGNNPNLSAARLSALGLNTIACGGLCAGGSNAGAPCTSNAQCSGGGTCPGATPPPYPPLPAGIQRNPALIDPPDGIPKTGLIVKFQDGVCVDGPQQGLACTSGAVCGAGHACTAKWVDEAGQDWSACLPLRLPDHDLFILDATNPAAAVQTVDHLGTTLFEVSVRPGTGTIYVPNTDARNFVRFEHALGVAGHMVDNQLTLVNPANSAVTRIDLNTHIDRSSNPALNGTERAASISQPGMMAWKADGSAAYLTAIGSRKLFRVDGGCQQGSCIFGPNRSAPAAVVVGEGPTGVALAEAKNRAYVLLRFANAVATVNTATLSKVGETPLHDPTPSATRDGRRFLYDGIDTSGHGDAACSSCHIAGDMDGLSWDLGNPEGSLAPYTGSDDNVRFVAPVNGNPQPCDPAVQPLCASHQGFDPQKGPMATQTLRAMLEPLHWRGDRATLRQFNKAFVGLMGTADVGPVNGEPAGLSSSDMDRYRSFALGISMPPNPFRRANDTLPFACSNDATRLCTDDSECASPGLCNAPVVQPPGSPFAGNPANGKVLFDTFGADAGQPCKACHALPFGTAGGKPGGVEPQNPTSPDATALFNGTADGSRHSDLEIPHLRNMYAKSGPRFGPPGTLNPPESKTGFGFIHDGSVPDLGTFLSSNVFALNAAQVRDIATFMFMFPSGIRPSVGRQVTVAAGAPPTGTAVEENLITTLIGVGNLADSTRHCELVAAAPSGGRLRTYALDGGGGTGGLWTTDVEGEAQIATASLRSAATGPLTFLCVPLGEGLRQGIDLDEDAHRNGTDCSMADPGTWAVATEIAGLAVAAGGPTHLSWTEEATATGPGVVYDIAGGDLSALRASGLAAATACLAGSSSVNAYDDVRPDPPPAAGYFYIARARNSCGDGGFGSGREALGALSCAP